MKNFLHNILNIDTLEGGVFAMLIIIIFGLLAFSGTI
jgi:hypothetical protein